MRKRDKMRAPLRYGITAAVGLLLTCMVLYIENYRGSYMILSERYRILCDGFCVPGLLLILMGALIFVSSEGAFDGISYGAKRFVRRFILFSTKEDERYSDYVEERRKNRKVTGYGCMFVVGLIFLAIGLVFLFLFYRFY